MSLNSYTKNDQVGQTTSIHIIVTEYLFFFLYFEQLPMPFTKFNCIFAETDNTVLKLAFLFPMQGLLLSHHSAMIKLVYPSLPWQNILYINTIRGLFQLQNGCSDICQTLHGKSSCIILTHELHEVKIFCHLQLSYILI